MRRHIFDAGFFKRRYCHVSYGIVYYDVPEAELGKWVIKFLKHHAFRIHAQRLSKVIHVSPTRLAYWELHASQMRKIEW